MAIIISKRGSPSAQMVEKSEFEKEHNLQEFIHEHPESLPVRDIQEDKRLFVAAREFPTDSGPIDALAVDNDGDIYIVETKLYRNPDKRSVVAQALDYGASLWKHLADFTEFRGALEDSARAKWNMGLEAKLREFFRIEDDEAKMLIEAMKTNVREGRLKFIILMDVIDERLKDLITYVNQNSRFDIYAVQLEYYQQDEYEIVIPRLFGAEMTQSPPARPRWDEQRMFEEAREKMSQEEFQWFEGIYRFVKEKADQLNFGVGSYASFGPVFQKLSTASLFTLCTDSDKRLSFNFAWVVNDHTAEDYKRVVDKAGFHFKENWRVTRPSVSISEWGPKTEAFIKAIKELLERG